ncbi:MAG: endolytic transglycosylase MltG [Alphaproteobacteria bacterium]|nr:endolytic transglycosylase MltG [Alphaproteobacteria bacterium]
MSVRRFEPELPGGQRSIRPRSPAEMLEPSRAPARPKGRRRRRESGALSRWIRFFSSVLTAVFLIMGAAGAGIFIVQSQYAAVGPLQQDRTIIIPRGEGRLEIAERLEREGIIGNRWIFIVNHLVRSTLNGDRLDMKAGEFHVAARASMEEVLGTLVEGKAVQYKITVPEGLTSQQVVARLQADENLTGEIAAIPLEGTLLPDTYPYARGADRQSVLGRMLQAQKDFLVGLWDKRQEGLPLNSIDEAIILASIVEKETAVAEERALTAAVFMNRLKKGMRLQSDPTIIYGIVGGRGSLGRPILKTDIQSKTPYNTYSINGLPPTAICNPGRESILAVLNPAATNALYFVADGTGGHTFSETLAEHNEAVAKWRRIEREQLKAAAEQAAASPVATVPKTAETADAVKAEVPTLAPEPPAAPADVAQSAGTSAAGPAVTPAAPVIAPGEMPLPQRKPR